MGEHCGHAWVFGCVWMWAHIAECCSSSRKGHTATFHCDIFMTLCQCFLAIWLLQGMFWSFSEFVCPFLISCVSIMSEAPLTFWLQPNQVNPWNVFRAALQQSKVKITFNCVQEFSLFSWILPWQYTVLWCRSNLLGTWRTDTPKTNCSK